MRKLLLILVFCVGCSEPQVGRLPVHWRKPARKLAARSVVEKVIRTYQEGQHYQMNFIEARYDANGLEAVEKIILDWKKTKRPEIHQD